VHYPFCDQPGEEAYDDVPDNVEHILFC
jgi:hypothetical protein